MTEVERRLYEQTRDKLYAKGNPRSFLKTFATIQAHSSFGGIPVAKTSHRQLLFFAGGTLHETFFHYGLVIGPLKPVRIFHRFAHCLRRDFIGNR